MGTVRRSRQARGRPLGAPSPAPELCGPAWRAPLPPPPVPGYKESAEGPRGRRHGRASPAPSIQPAVWQHRAHRPARGDPPLRHRLSRVGQGRGTRAAGGSGWDTQ